MRYSLTAIQWARVKSYVSGKTRAELHREAPHRLQLAHLLAAVSENAQWYRVGWRHHGLAPELVQEALKWCKADA
jgi:hypothetical protein